MALTSTLVWLSLGSSWLLPAMFVQGLVPVHHFSLQHECCHYTAFKTRWLKDFFGNVCGLDATSGEAKAAPVTRALKMYETRVVDGKVQIKMEKGS